LDQGGCNARANHLQNQFHDFIDVFYDISGFLPLWLVESLPVSAKDGKNLNGGESPHTGV
jgi:hypothetical protein